MSQSSASPVTYVDVFAAAHDALKDEIALGQVLLDQMDQTRFMIFCTQETATKMPDNIRAKLQKAWLF